jgi:hypothetical protein
MNSLRLFLLAILSLPFVLLTSCSNDGGSNRGLQAERMQVMMSVPWRYDAEAIFQMVDFSQMSPQQADIIRATAPSMSKSYISFLPDSIMTYQLPTGERLQGWWAVSEDGQEILIQATPRKVKPMKVESFSPGRIILNNDPEEGFYYPKVLVPAVDLESAQ